MTNTLPNLSDGQAEAIAQLLGAEREDVRIAFEKMRKAPIEAKDWRDQEGYPAYGLIREVQNVLLNKQWLTVLAIIDDEQLAGTQQDHDRALDT